MSPAELANEVVRRLSARYRASLVERIGGRDSFRVLVATILSQRTRDEVTERVAGEFFKRWKSVEALASADENDVRETIKEVGLAPAKARYLIESARIIMERFGGRVPAKEEDLMALPGVGQKTAGCVLVYAFARPAIPVDTHVHRIANLLGLVRTKTPKQTKKALEKLLPREIWLPVNRIFVLFGREICKPQKPRCPRCPIKDLCPSHKE